MAPSSCHRTPLPTVPERFAPLTKGFEFEFLLAYRWNEDENGNIEIPLPDDVPALIIDGCVVVSNKWYRDTMDGAPDDEDTPSDRKEYAQLQCDILLYDLLRSKGIEVNDPRAQSSSHVAWPAHDPSHRNAALTLNPKYYRWGIKRDHSLIWGWLQFWGTDGAYQLHDVELVSPVMLADSEESNHELRAVLRVVKENFVYFTPKSTGLHIHIGLGQEKFNTVHMRQIASLLFMVDRSMYTDLHPEWRRENYMNHPSLRVDSNVALGMDSRDANTLGVLANDMWNVVNMSERDRPVDVMKGVETLLSANRAEAIRKLASTVNRGCYYFGNVPGPLGTIECRQAAGTLNEEWALNWAKILTRTVDYARRSGEDHIWNDLCPLFDILEAGTLPALTIDSFLRKVLQLEHEADYIQRTTPEQRSVPAPSEIQKMWRNNPGLAAQVGLEMLPEIE